MECIIKFANESDKGQDSSVRENILAKLSVCFPRLGYSLGQDLRAITIVFLGLVMMMHGKLEMETVAPPQVASLRWPDDNDPWHLLYAVSMRGSQTWVQFKTSHYRICMTRGSYQNFTGSRVYQTHTNRPHPKPGIRFRRRRARGSVELLPICRQPTGVALEGDSGSSSGGVKLEGSLSEWCRTSRDEG